MADDFSRDGHTYATAAIYEFVNATHVTHDAALANAFSAPGEHGIPAIQLGPAEAKLIAMLLRLCAARKVVEIGTLVGYSTLWLARALPRGGHLWSLELDAKHAAIARQHLAEGAVADCATVLEGAALETLRTLETSGPFDAVFIDADKPNYVHYGRWAARHVRPGGLMIADNVYLFGKLMAAGDEAAEAMRRFHTESARYFDTTCIPTPDGLLLGIRNSVPVM